MKPDNGRDTAGEIVRDITQRAGGDAWWYSMESDVRAQVIEAWAGIIRSDRADFLTNVTVDDELMAHLGAIVEPDAKGIEGKPTVERLADALYALVESADG